MKSPLLLIAFALLIASINPPCARADSNSLTFDQFQKMLDSQKSDIKIVNLTNGQPVLDVKLVNEVVDKTVDIPADKRAGLIQQIIAAGVPLRVHDSLLKWTQYKVNLSNGDEGIDFAQLANLMAEGKTSTISHVDDFENTNLLDVTLQNAKPDEVVVPAELKKDMVAELARKGVTVERKPAKQDFSLILPAFIAAIAALGAFYMFVPMKLGAEINGAPTLRFTKSDESTSATTDSADS
ncbi:MAG TPA: hypothetical protein V6C76_01095 [Drouetiella sp.]